MKQIAKKGAKGGKGKGKKSNQGTVRSAQELGLAAKSLGINDKAKTHKGRKIKESKAPKLIENSKKSIIMKGRKSSEILNSLLRELHMMRGSEMSQLLMRKAHDILPFEDASMIESTSVKYDASLFAVGSHQKKRPDNLILGRVFDGHILDMFEMGIEQYRGMDQFTPAEHITKDLKPILIFQGEPFDNSDKHQRLKNLLIGKF